MLGVDVKMPRPRAKMVVGFIQMPVLGVEMVVGLVQMAGLGIKMPISCVKMLVQRTRTARSGTKIPSGHASIPTGYAKRVKEGG